LRFGRAAPASVGGKGIQAWKAMNEKTETVILIHGLWMHGIVLLPYQRWLRAEGFAVRRFSYPSRRAGLDANVRLLSAFVSETPGVVIHLVAHSLGGLVALKMLSQEADPRLRRVVLLGTPVAACHCGSTLAAIPVLGPLVGRTFEDWFRLPRPALPAAAEIGIIAGTRRISFGRMIPGLPRPNDGLVAVDETRLATAKDSVALNVSHSGMLASRTCAGQVAGFLRTGSFNHV
jgi:pimeloyl-ACP methyl ester carboxylesterase